MTATMPLLVACSVDVTETTEPADGPIHVQDYGVPVHSHVSTLLTHSTSLTLQASGDVETSARATAVLTNGSDLVDVTAVSLNSTSLNRTYTGHYLYESRSDIGDREDFLNWLVLGDRSTSMTRNQTAPAPVRIMGVGYMDTITASHGMVIRYTGARGAGDVEATLIPTGKRSSSLQATNDAMAATITVDKGTVTFTRDQLDCLRPNTTYDLTLRRGRYIESKVNGRWVGQYASTTYTVRVLLKR